MIYYHQEPHINQTLIINRRQSLSVFLHTKFGPLFLFWLDRSIKYDDFVLGRFERFVFVTLLRNNKQQIIMSSCIDDNTTTDPDLMLLEDSVTASTSTRNTHQSEPVPTWGSDLNGPDGYFHVQRDEQEEKAIANAMLEQFEECKSSKRLGFGFVISLLCWDGIIWQGDSFPRKRQVRQRSR